MLNSKFMPAASIALLFDSTGSEQHNQQLSERRADSVAAYLVSRKVTGERLIVLGAGEAYPISSNETAAGRQLNRRVEITIVPLTAGSS